LGPTGLSVFSDDADWSVRDVATSMIMVIDNAATDLMVELVGTDQEGGRCATP
jgi:beta-lactamase class A